MFQSVRANVRLNIAIPIRFWSLIWVLVHKSEVQAKSRNCSRADPRIRTASPRKGAGKGASPEKPPLKPSCIPPKISHSNFGAVAGRVVQNSSLKETSHSTSTLRSLIEREREREPLPKQHEHPLPFSFWGKDTPKDFCNKDFAELLGELSGAICLKTLALLGSALELFRKFFGAVRAISPNSRKLRPKQSLALSLTSTSRELLATKANQWMGESAWSVQSVPKRGCAAIALLQTGKQHAIVQTGSSNSSTIRGTRILITNDGEEIFVHPAGDLAISPPSFDPEEFRSGNFALGPQAIAPPCPWNLPDVIPLEFRPSNSTAIIQLNITIRLTCCTLLMVYVSAPLCDCRLF